MKYKNKLHFLQTRYTHVARAATCLVAHQNVGAYSKYSWYKCQLCDDALVEDMDDRCPVPDRHDEVCHQHVVDHLGRGREQVLEKVHSSIYIISDDK